MYYVLMGFLLLSCLEKTPKTRCKGMEEITFTEGTGPDKKEDPLFGDKKPDEGCKAQ